MLVVVVVIGVVAYVVSNLMGQVLNSLDNEEFQLEAQMLAGDLKEYTKYLLAYEKVTFVDSPIRRSETRRDQLLELWKQTTSQPDLWKQLNIQNVCGGYDMGGKLLGTLEIDGDRVFCPVIIRRPDLTTKLIEDSFLDVWARSEGEALIWKNGEHAQKTMADVFITKDAATGNDLPEGQYRLEYNFGRFPGRDEQDRDWFVRPDNSIPVYVGQKLLELARDPKMGFEVEAKVVVDMFTDSMGYVGKLSERFFRIRSEVLIRRGKNVKPFVEVESFVMRTPTVKDFVLFIAYPMDSTGANTRSFKAAVQLSPTSEVVGRVYFNGDIDTELKDLPNFHDTVFISGNFTADASDLRLYRSKFRRGLVTNISSARFLFDGDCLPDQPAPDPYQRSILNGTGIRCRTAGGVRSIDAYSAFADSPCKCYPRRYIENKDGLKYWVYKPQDTPGVPCTSALTVEQCNDQLTSASGFFRSSGEANLQLKDTEYILAAARRVTAIGPATVFGTIVGGHIAGGSNTMKFYSLNELKPGIPGIGSASTLSAISAQANSSTFGVESPLVNFPLIQYAKDSFK